MESTVNPIEGIVRRHRAGEAVCVYSVCSSHPLVLRAAMRQAFEDDSALLIEVTSNQVDEFADYTGRTPEQFREQVRGFADEESFPRERLVLGGDRPSRNRRQREARRRRLRRPTSTPTRMLRPSM